MSALRCRPGDLAVVVGNLDIYIGHIVRCVAPTADRITGERGWIVDPQLGNWRGIVDKALRPIRDPGDNAVDQSLTWLPSPSREREAA